MCLDPRICLLWVGTYAPVRRMVVGPCSQKAVTSGETNGKKIMFYPVVLLLLFFFYIYVG